MSIPILLLLAAATAEPPRTMRLDYFHSGTAAEERFALDRVSLEAAWPGPPDRLLDETNSGKYSFEVVDRATNRVLSMAGNLPMR